MLTDISPIFGCTLLELVELGTILVGIFTILAPIATLVVAYVIYHSNKNQIKEQQEIHKNQMEQQKKINSMKILWMVHSPWRNNSEFKTFLRDLNYENLYYDDDILTGMLNRFEYIATFVDDKLIYEYQVKSLIGADIKAVRDNKHIRRFILTIQKKDPNAYSDLDKLFEKSRNWD